MRSGWWRRFYRGWFFKNFIDNFLKRHFCFLNYVTKPNLYAASGSDSGSDSGSVSGSGTDSSADSGSASVSACDPGSANTRSPKMITRKNRARQKLKF